MSKRRYPLACGVNQIKRGAGSRAGLEYFNGEGEYEISFIK